MQQPDYQNITPRQLKARLDAGDRPRLLDVREPWEFSLSRIEGSELMPLGELPRRSSELDPGGEIVVICHHGIRSAHVTRALDQAGFQNVLNLEGGLDAYSDIDDSIPRY